MVTVIAVEPRGMATIRTSGGTTYHVIQGTRWRVGDTVACEHIPRVRTSWQVLDCRNIV